MSVRVIKDAVDTTTNELIYFKGHAKSTYMSDGATVEDVIKSLSLDKIYPIGSIYLSVSSVNPAQLFNFGEWEQIKDVFLLGASNTYSVGSTGGESSHTLSVNEIPSHYHTTHGIGIATTAYEKNLALRSVNLSELHEGDIVMRTNSEGGGGAHNNMPPYLAVYMWKRIK